MAYNPPIGSIYHLYTTYILPSGGLYATYHLLGEPETTIDEKEFRARCTWHADGSSTTRWVATVHKSGTEEVENIKLHRRGAMEVFSWEAFMDRIMLR